MRWHSRHLTANLRVLTRNKCTTEMHIPNSFSFQTKNKKKIITKITTIIFGFGARAQRQFFFDFWQAYDRRWDLEVNFEKWPTAAAAQEVKLDQQEVRLLSELGEGRGGGETPQEETPG